jgi:Holliday junction resolvase RusA-like endonuclease
MWRDPKTGGDRVKYAQPTVQHRNLAIGILRDAWAGEDPLAGPVAVRVVATFPRPKAHYGTGRNAGVLKDWAPIWHAQAPDNDKCLRLVGDSLTIAGVIVDDGQVAIWRGEKVWGVQGSTLVEVWPLT